MGKKKKTTKRKKNMKKKSSKQRFSSQDKEIIGLFFIILGILSLISIFSPNMGLVGDFLSLSLTYLTGKGAIIIPINLMIIGSLLIQNETGFSKRKLSFLCLWISLCALILLDKSLVGKWSFVEKISHLKNKSILLESGGTIGAIFGFLFYHLFGTTGTYFTLSIITLVYVIYLLPYSFREIKVIALKLIRSLKESYKKSKTVKKKPTNPKRKSKEKKKKKSKEEQIQFRGFEDSPLENKNDSLEIIDYTKEVNEKKEKATPISNKEKERWKEELQDTITPDYVFPPIELLQHLEKSATLSKDIIRENGRKIEETMENFGIDCRIVAINRGPVITCYELEPAPGVRLNKIVNLADNLSMALASSDIRIEAPIPGKSAVGIEVPNPISDPVGYREIVESTEFKQSGDTPLVLGKDVSGKIIASSIDKMPHLLIAGATGSGKSVCINTIITGILYHSKPENVRLILIDPKIVELSVYNGIPHLLIPVVTDPKKAAFALNWAVDEMEKRYKLFAKTSVRDMASYNAKMRKQELFKEVLPKIVIIVDELSDLMMVAAGEVEDYIARLAQMARAAGIYLIIATQRPSVDVITGTIKANIPSRIAFAVSSAVDSRTILDMGGAEKLLGKGDMLFYPSFYSKPKRVQGAFISDEEVENITSFIRVNSEDFSYDKKIEETIEEKKEIISNPVDEYTEEAIEIILRDEQASISYLQRKLKIGYSRAARIIDEIEEMGIIGPPEGSKPRKILLTEEEKEEYLGVKDE
ncbi:MAG: DNA translocase FtsK 4TM domain-containing protein [Tissierellia bacterium]|nr:DNA translocase FtsK 4TM domain-containing protein [Tissierellia bacterium]